jgi:hypothetical protein
MLILCVFLLSQNNTDNIYLRLFGGLSFFVFISLLFGIVIGTSQHNIQSKNKNYQETIRLLVVLPIFFGVILPGVLYTINSTVLWNNILSVVFLFLLSLFIYIICRVILSKETADDTHTDESLFNFKYGPDNFRFLQKYTFSSFAIWISMILTILVVSTS